jgi:CIC family chloride channel protein
MPLHTADAGAYALVGMGALFAGIIRAPMTSVIMIFEITQDYQILVPLMVANLLSLVISRRFQPTPIYHALLRQDHVHLPTPVAGEEDGPWTAADVMNAEYRFIAPDEPLATVWNTASGDGSSSWLIGTPARLIAVVSAERLRMAAAAGRLADPITAVAEPDLIHAHPDHPSDVVLERLAHGGGVLPIVSRDDARRVVGVVTVAHIMRFMRVRRARTAPFE